MPVKIFATDLDSAALLYAGKGLYHRDSVKDIPAEILHQYFIKEQENYRIIPAIRQMVIFAQHDLARNPPYCNMHFISCRNLLIYMTPLLQKKVFSMLLFGLKFNGYLFLGASETPASIIDNLEVISKNGDCIKTSAKSGSSTSMRFRSPNRKAPLRPLIPGQYRQKQGKRYGGKRERGAGWGTELPGH